MGAGSLSSPVVERRPAAPASVPLVGGARLPLAFIAAGLAMLAAAVTLLLLAPQNLLLPFHHPHVVGLVHLWLPGFLLTVCMGAVYQLMPVVLGVPLQLPVRAAWVHWTLHVVAVPLLVAGFLRGRYDWVALGGIGLTAGLAILSVATLRTFQASQRRDAAAWCFPAAGVWLALTVLLGVALALNRKWAILPLSVLDLLRAHAHLGLVGFFLSLLQGVTFQLVPMFTMGTLQRPRAVRAGLAATQLGLLGLAPGLAWDQGWLTMAAAATVLAGLAASGVALHATLRTRRRRKLETGVRAFVFGAAGLGLAGGVGLLALVAPAAWTEGMPLAMVYGVLVIGGGLSLTVLGMLCKIVPFLVWMRAYGPAVGKRPVPIATTLASAPLESAWLRLHAAAVVTLAVGVATQSFALAGAGTVLLAAAVALLLANLGWVARHLFRPVAAALPTTPAFQK